MACLRRLTPQGTLALEPPVPLIANETTIGRAKGNTIVVNDQGVSRKHARIVSTPEGHAIFDEGSDNGVLVGSLRVHRRVLQDGDVIQIGFTRWQYAADDDQKQTMHIPAMQAIPLAPDQIAMQTPVAPPVAMQTPVAPPVAMQTPVAMLAAAPSPAPARAASSKPRAAAPRRSGKAGWVVAILIVFCAAGAGGWWLARKRGATDSSTGGAKPLTPSAFSDRAATLSDRLARLNQRELELLASDGADRAALESKLVDIGVAAREVGAQAEALAHTTAAQSDPTRAALDHTRNYQAVARLAYAIEFETADARDWLRAGNDAGAVRYLVAEYGARLRSPDGGTGNPFLAHLSNRALVADTQAVSADDARRLRDAAGGKLVAWIAVSRDSAPRRLTIPEREPHDDTAKVRRAAFARLAGVGGRIDGPNVQVLLAKGAVVQPGDADLTSYPGGAATAVHDGGGGVTQALYNAVPGAPLVASGQVAVVATKPAATLAVESVHRPPDGAKDLQVYVQLKWQSNVDGPIELRCAVELYSNSVAREVEGRGGSVQIVLTLNTRDVPRDALPLTCSAARDDVTIGSVQASVPPTRGFPPDAGPPAAAPIDAGALAIPTPAADAAPRRPAGDTSWIEPYLAEITERLLRRNKDGVAIAIVIETLRTCLYEQAKTLPEREAKRACASALGDTFGSAPPDTPPTPPPVKTGRAPITVEGDYTETLAVTGFSLPAAARFTLRFDFDKQTVTGSISVKGSNDGTAFKCGDLDEYRVRYEAGYRMDVAGKLDPSGSYTAEGRISGDIRAETIKPFTVEGCTGGNGAAKSQICCTGWLGGAARITGSVSETNVVEMKTSWSHAEWTASGSWTGKGGPDPI